MAQAKTLFASLLIIAAAALPASANPMGTAASTPWTPVTTWTACRSQCMGEQDCRSYEVAHDADHVLQCKLYMGDALSEAGMVVNKVANDPRNGAYTMYCQRGDEVSVHGQLRCLTDWDRQGSADNRRADNRLPSTYNGTQAIHDDFARGYRVLRGRP